MDEKPSADSYVIYSNHLTSPSYVSDELRLSENETNAALVAQDLQLPT